MQFEISHELAVPLEALEAALLSRELRPEFARRLASIESVTSAAHDDDGQRLHRVWRFQARAPLRILRGRNITRDMMTWNMVWSYRREQRTAEWHVVPRPGVDPDAAWRQRFHARGDCRLTAVGERRTKRTIEGEIAIELKWIGGLVERKAVAELRKSYDTEAEALLWLCRRNEADG